MLESLFNKVASLKTSNFIKKRLQDRCFPEKFTKFLKRSFFNRTPPVAASERRKVTKPHSYIP